MTIRRRAMLVGLCLAAVVGLAGCGSSAPPTPYPSLPADAVLFTAKGTAFTTTSVHIPAGKPWTLALDNQDNLPHNVVIIDKDNNSIFTSSLVNGPALKAEPGPTLAAGAYTFICAVHPEMHGVITVP